MRKTPPLLSCFCRCLFLYEIQHSYSGKTTVLKLSKSSCFNFTLSQSFAKMLRKWNCVDLDDKGENSTNAETQRKGQGSK